jgi:hypothetical protein
MSILVLLLAVVFLCVVPMWKIYTKAEQPGWAVLVPIYSIIVLLQIVRKPLWWIVMFFIPVANLVFLIMTYHELSKAFGKDIGTTLGLLFLPIIFVPILGYGDAKYQWPTVMEVEVIERKDLE